MSTLARKTTAMAATLLLVALILAVAGAPVLAAAPWTFTTGASGTSQSLTAGCALDANHVWAGGGADTVVFYNGSTWESQPVPMTPSIFVGALASADATHTWAVGDNLDIFFSDGGTAGNWVVQNSGGTGNFYGACAVNTSNVWAVGGTTTGPYTSVIYYWNGTSWTSEAPAGIHDQFKAVSGFDADHVWAVGYDSTSYGHIYFRGASHTWNSTPVFTTPAATRLRGVCAIDANHVWAVGDGGAIYFYNGTSWAADPQSGVGGASPITTQAQFMVNAKDASHVFSAGSGNTILVYNGTTWTLYNGPDGTANQRTVLPTSKTGLWVTGQSGKAFKGVAPSIASCSVNEGGQGQTLNVAITGTNTNFTASSAASFSGTGITVNSTTYTDPTHVTANITIDGAATLGARDVNVVTGTETPDALVGGFTVKTVHTITVTQTANGTITPAGPSVSVLDGNNQAFTIAADPHYHIVDVVTDAGSQGAVGGYTFNNVTSNHTITATYAITTHDLTVTYGAHGSVTPSGTVTVNDGASQQFTISPDVHYFATVSINGGTATSITSPWTYTNVVANDSLDFEFSNVTHKVTVTQPLSDGTISPAGPDVAVVEGADQTFNMNPVDAHHECTSITTDTGSYAGAASYTFHDVEADHTITATFDWIKHTITPSVEGNGTITPNTPQVVNDGDSSPQFQMNPVAHHHLSQLLVDGSPVLPPPLTYTFNNVTANHSIAASFAIDQFAVNASVTGGHGTALPATQTIDYDGTATVNITPDPYYTIASITDNGTPVALSRTYTINNVQAVHNVVVRFALTAPAVTSASPTSTKPGANVTINGSCFGPTQGTSTVTIGGVPAQIVSWSNTSIVATIGEGASSGSVVVKTVGGSSNTDKTVKIYYPTWYLAEGTTAWGFGCAINIANPNNQDLNVRITYMLAGGSTKVQNVGLPKMSQVVVNPQDTIGNKDFSTKVECLQGKNIAVDRTMAWASGSGQRMGKHNSIGVTAPAKTWYLPDGSSDWGLETWLLIQNPGSKVASCDVTYMIEGIGPKTINHKIAAHSRASFDMASEIGKADASIQVHSNVGVIPERSIYTHWTSPESGTDMRREGSDSVGTTTPAKDFYLAEGSTNWGFTTYVLVQNPNAVPAQVTLSYVSTKGLKTDATFTMKAQSRKTVTVNDKYPGLDFSTKVHSNQPIVAERSMYWSAGANTGRATHNSIGVPSAHKAWYLPAGTISPDNGGTETYTLVQNPNSSAVKVKITYLNRGGKNDAVFYDTIPANSRKTYNMADKYASGASASASAIVESTTTGKKIIVERSIYNNAKWGGTDSIGGFSD